MPYSALQKPQSNHVKEPFIILTGVIMVLLQKLRLKYGYYTTTTEIFIRVHRILHRLNDCKHIFSNS